MQILKQILVCIYWKSGLPRFIFFMLMIQIYIYRFTYIWKSSNWYKSQIFGAPWKTSADGKQIEKKISLKIVMNLADSDQLLFDNFNVL